ncbi:MAG: hypothetical protein NZZ41_01035 [Candidatus Dojkabacteria bacterium]|nr:hypothetical protein [Candidatus Dojkabacteria bacterium]
MYKILIENKEAKDTPLGKYFSIKEKYTNLEEAKEDYKKISQYTYRVKIEKINEKID